MKRCRLHKSARLLADARHLRRVRRPRTQRDTPSGLRRFWLDPPFLVQAAEPLLFCRALAASWPARTVRATPGQKQPWLPALKAELTGPGPVAGSRIRWLQLPLRRRGRTPPQPAFLSFGSLHTSNQVQWNERPEAPPHWSCADGRTQRERTSFRLWPSALDGRMAPSPCR